MLAREPKRPGPRSNAGGRVRSKTLAPPFGPEGLLQLQQSAGNRAVSGHQLLDRNRVKAVPRPPAPPTGPWLPTARRVTRQNYVGWVVQRVPGPTKFAAMAFAPKELTADGASTSTASVRTNPRGVALNWSLPGGEAGSTIAATGVITAGKGLPLTPKFVPMAVKAEDAADTTRSKTGSIKLWSEDFKKAMTDFATFRSASYALPNYAIGVNGKFDATYSPPAKRLSVVVKVAFAFQGVWSKKAKASYRAAYIGRVQQAWSGQFTFVNVREPKDVWGKLGPVGVRVRIQEVKVGTQHFLIQPAKTVGTAQVAGGVTKLFKGDLTPQKAFNPQTGAGELTRLNRITPTPIQFAAGSAAIPAADQPKLVFMATYLKRIHNPRFTVTIVGHANDAATNKANATLSQQRAAAVRTELRNAGLVGHRVVVVGRGATGSVAGDATWQKTVMTSALPPGWQNEQATAVHEFGHMLGLGDEYGGAPGGPANATHHALTAAAFGNAYADQVAKRGDTDSASIMEGGDDVRAQHYVTMWSALCDASAKAAVPTPVFGQADWKFVG